MLLSCRCVTHRVTLTHQDLWVFLPIPLQSNEGGCRAVLMGRGSTQEVTRVSLSCQSEQIVQVFLNQLIATLVLFFCVLTLKVSASSSKCAQGGPLSGQVWAYSKVRVLQLGLAQGHEGSAKVLLLGKECALDTFCSSTAGLGSI